MLTRRISGVITALCLIAAAAFLPIPALAQMAEIKEKPPMYSYVSFWAIPRTQWAELEKSNSADDQILQKALTSGTLVGYGRDVNLIHQPDQETHDDWWSAMSLAGVLNVLDQFYKSGATASPVLASATKHWDGIFVSRYYSWRAGSWKGAYTQGAMYRLKKDVPQHALDLLSKSVIVPMLDKLLANGTIAEYEIDTEAMHTEAPGTFWIFFLSPNAEGLDKVNAALFETIRTNPLVVPAFESMVEHDAHRDFLAKSDVTYK